LLISYKPEPQNAITTDPIPLISKKGFSNINKIAEKYKKRPNKLNKIKAKGLQRKKTFAYQITPFSYYKTYSIGIFHISF